MDRRVWVFLVCALACVLLIPFADFNKPHAPHEKPKPGAQSQDYRWVPEITAGAYLVLAALVAADSVSKSARHERPSEEDRA
jgi:hypothetical protein